MTLSFLNSKLAEIRKQYNAVKHLTGTRPAYLKGQVDLLEELVKHKKERKCLLELKKEEVSPLGDK